MTSGFELELELYQLHSLGTILGTDKLNTVKLGRPLILGWFLEKEHWL